MKSTEIHFRPPDSTFSFDPMFTWSSPFSTLGRVLLGFTGWLRRLFSSPSVLSHLPVARDLTSLVSAYTYPTPTFRNTGDVTQMTGDKVDTDLPRCVLV